MDEISFDYYCISSPFKDTHVSASRDGSAILVFDENDDEIDWDLLSPRDRSLIRDWVQYYIDLRGSFEESIWLS